jgi:hypothetical protein
MLFIQIFPYKIPSFEIKNNIFETTPFRRSFLFIPKVYFTFKLKKVIKKVQKNYYAKKQQIFEFVKIKLEVKVLIFKESFLEERPCPDESLKVCSA